MKEAEHDVAEIACNALKDCPPDEGGSSSCGKSPFEDLHGLPDDDDDGDDGGGDDDDDDYDGTPICRAHCFPVGKIPDMPLPEFLDCTARTSLDMLSERYYLAVGVSFVLFQPASDAHETESSSEISSWQGVARSHRKMLKEIQRNVYKQHFKIKKNGNKVWRRRNKS